MPEPRLNILQRYSVCEQKRSTGVTQIVKANFSKSMLFKELRKLLCYITRLHNITKETYEAAYKYIKKEDFSGREISPLN